MLTAAKKRDQHIKNQRRSTMKAQLYHKPNKGYKGPVQNGSQAIHQMNSKQGTLINCSQRKNIRFNKRDSAGACDTQVRKSVENPNRLLQKFFVDKQADIELPKGFLENVPTKDILSIDDFEIYDTGKLTEFQSFKLIDGETNRMVATFMSRKDCEFILKRYNMIIHILTTLFLIKPPLTRNKAHAGFSDFYVGVGTRLDQNGNLGTYVYDGPKLAKLAFDRRQKEKHILADCKRVTGILVNELQRIAFPHIDPRTLDAIKWMEQIDFEKSISLSGSGGYSQLVVTRNYLSASHEDLDAVPGTVGCFHPTNPNSTEILLHFLFPGLNLAVPMRHGNVLLFDPTFMHCSSSPRVKEAVLFSAYTASKTVDMHTHRFLEEMGLEMEVTPQYVAAAAAAILKSKNNKK